MHYKNTNLLFTTKKQRNTYSTQRSINLTHVKFTKEQLDTLNLGFNYATEKDSKSYINALRANVENMVSS
jgi:hypothetical protein